MSYPVTIIPYARPLTNAELQAAIDAYIEILKIEANTPSIMSIDTPNAERDEMLLALQREQVRRATISNIFPETESENNKKPHGVTTFPPNH